MIELYTYGTINGRAAVIAMEATGLEYTLCYVDLKNAAHQSDDFLRINSSGRIPAIVDRDYNPHLTLSQTCSILIYLAEKSGRFLSTEQKNRAVTLQWLHFIATDISTNLFNNFYLKSLITPNYPEAGTALKHRAINFCRELEHQLADHQFLAGDDISIADMIAVPVIDLLQSDLVNNNQLNLMRWFDQMLSFEFVHKGLEI